MDDALWQCTGPTIKEAKIEYISKLLNNKMFDANIIEKYVNIFLKENIHDDKLPRGSWQAFMLGFDSDIEEIKKLISTEN